MSDPKRRPVSSWPASLLPSLMLVAVVAGSAATAQASSDKSPVVEMTVTTAK